MTVFDERLLGRPPEPGEWDHLDEGYFAAYRRRLASLRLVAGADEALVGPLDADEVLVVGDSVDDARSAAALGLRCVLVAGGPEHPQARHETGVAVVPSLAEAVGADTGRR